VVHEPWTESTIISYCKIIPKPENPHHLTNNPLYLSIIKSQSTFLLNRTLGFKKYSRLALATFQKLQIGPCNIFSSYLCNRNSDFGNSCAKILRIFHSFISCIRNTFLLHIDLLCAYSRLDHIVPESFSGDFQDQAFKGSQPFFVDQQGKLP
jgi:hypothetical protein